MDDRLTFLGHSTVVVELDGVRILTDPVLGNMAWGAIRRMVPVAAPAALANLDAVFISHGHFDHLDLASLRALAGRPTFIVPAGLGRVVARVVDGPVREVRAGDHVRVAGLDLEVVPAEHSRRRSPFTIAEGALGALMAGSATVYFAGDTDLFPEMRRLTGLVDVALLPVGGWGPTLGRGHLDPGRAAEAATLIRPGIAVPIHWGTLYPYGLRRIARRRFEGPGEKFRAALEARDVHVVARILEPGQSMAIDGAARR